MGDNVLTQQAAERMSGLVNLEHQRIIQDTVQEIVKDLEDEGFDSIEIREFIKRMI